MKKNTLDEEIRRYYEREQLSNDTIERIRSTMATAGQPVRGRRRWMWIAAALLLVVVGGTWLQRSSGQNERAADDLARLVARDHNRHLDVEVAARDYADLRAKMTRINFTPVQPSKFATMPMRLLGARYASVDGEPAAALKLVDPKGEVCTLLQMRPVDRLSEIDKPSTHHVDGLIVDVWIEKGLVMALARPA